MKRSRLSRERAQILMLAAILLPVLLAMAGLAVDVGAYASDRRALQNAADSIALAAGQELPDAAAVQSRALEYAAEHDIDAGDMTVTVTGGTTEPRVRVELERPHDFVFMGVVGIEEKDVGGVAAAGKFSYGGGDGVVPWSVTEETVNAANSGDEMIVKYDSDNNPGYGEYGAIRIDGNGASTYRDSGKYGSDKTICSTGTPNCTEEACDGGTFPTGCAEDSVCEGPMCDSENGNMTGPTEEIVDFRKANTAPACDTFEKAFSPVSAYHNSGVDGALYTFGRADAGGGGRLAAPASHHGAGTIPRSRPHRARPRTRPR
jgi:hypothetical protein